MAVHARLLYLLWNSTSLLGSLATLAPHSLLSVLSADASLSLQTLLVLSTTPYLFESCMASIGGDHDCSVILSPDQKCKSSSPCHSTVNIINWAVMPATGTSSGHLSHSHRLPRASCRRSVLNLTFVRPERGLHASSAYIHPGIVLA